MADEFLAGPVEKHEPQVGRVLDEDHVRERLDDLVDQVEQILGSDPGRTL